MLLQTWSSLLYRYGTEKTGFSALHTLSVISFRVYMRVKEDFVIATICILGAIIPLLIATWIILRP